MKKKFYTAIAIIAFLGLSNSSFAQSNHPCEAEVNTRLTVQNTRIDNKEFHGTINAPEADRLHREDQHINREENKMENRHGGCVTKPEQHRLNRQENKINRQLRFRH